MTASPVQPASAAMPSEEEMLTAYNAIWQAAPGIDAHNVDIVRREAISAVLALFAPILAEKERDNCQLRLEVAEERETSRISIYGWRDKANEMEAALAAAHDAYQQAAVDAVALFQAAEARALTAEAALAAERERFEAMVRAYEARSLEDERSRLEAAAPLSARETARYLEIDQKLAGLNAAAIRAQGE